jgi:hypothetical protein
VGFVKTESWVVETPPRVPDALLRVLDHRWLRDSVALLFSFVVVAGLIVALISLGKVELPSRAAIEHSITTFDIASVSAQPQGASSAASASLPPVPTPTVAAVAPPPLPEWSVTTLPPAPVPAPDPPQLAAATPALTSGQGMSATGNGSGAGYDPYAFASYQKPDPTRLAGASATASLQPLPDALARLSAALLQRSAGSGQPVGVRAYVDPSGRVVRVELLSTTAPELAQSLARIAPGFLLCAPDPTRAPNANLIVTLTV